MSRSIKSKKSSSLLILLLISLISTISCTSFCEYCHCYNEKASLSITPNDGNTNETYHVVNCDGNRLINKNDIATAYKMQTLEWPVVEKHKIIGYFNNLNLTVLPRYESLN